MASITTATPADAPALKDLLEAAYRGDSARAGWNHEADILDDELDRLTDRTVSLMGPIIILVLSVFVGFIITSLMGAVISINDLAI